MQIKWDSEKNVQIIDEVTPEDMGILLFAIDLAMTTTTSNERLEEFRKMRERLLATK
jgi:hypothetical protein